MLRAVRQLGLAFALDAREANRERLATTQCEALVRVGPLKAISVRSDFPKVGRLLVV